MRSYKGRKAIVISTVSWIGGKNPFLGWAYVATASLFVLLAILGTIRHMIKPRSVFVTYRPCTVLTCFPSLQETWRYDIVVMESSMIDTQI